METWICGSLFVSPVQPYSRANAIVLAQMSICPAIWTERHVHEQSACEAGFGARSARLRMARLNGTCPHLKSDEPRWRQPIGHVPLPRSCLNGAAHLARIHHPVSASMAQPIGHDPLPCSCLNGAAHRARSPSFFSRRNI